MSCGAKDRKVHNVAPAHAHHDKISFRVGGMFKDSPTSERSVIIAAQSKLRAAAAADRGLITTAQDNTRRMLTQLLQGIGVKRVTVRFQAAPAV